jgi:alkylhydroperoxidase/carboxymuconolactone decarboxylase family protein
VKYYDSKDLKLIDEFKGYSPELFEAYSDWSSKVFSEGALSKKVKALIALSVAHVVQCPYCIDVYTKISDGCGATKEELAEAIHAGSVIRGGAALFHSIQAVKVLEDEE